MRVNISLISPINHCTCKYMCVISRRMQKYLHILLSEQAARYIGTGTNIPTQGSRGIGP